MSKPKGGPQWGLLARKRTMLRSARQRASKRGLPFNLTLDDFGIPERCPALGIEITLGGDTDSSPSLDRVVPSMGYVRGNVVVISNRANRIKNNASAYELRRIAEFLETHINNDWMKPCSNTSRGHVAPVGLFRSTRSSRQS